MILKEILKNIEYTCNVSEEKLNSLDISDIIYDSRKAADGTLFVCISGAVFDGHNYAKAAYQFGTRAFIVSHKVDLPEDAVQIVTEETRVALALCSAAFFGEPARSLAIIGITGTKGKTTTASILADILNEGGINTAYIGTTGIAYNGVNIPTKNTTPESYELHKAFADMVKNGVSCVVMEVSSQAIYMKRVSGISFHIGIFTNLSRDHIGGVEHPTFEHYMACKAELFKMCRYGIFNSDDQYFTEIIKNSSSINSTYGIGENITHDVSASDIKMFKTENSLGTSFVCKSFFGQNEYRIKIPGEFNVYNALAAISAAQRMSIPQSAIESVLENASALGRFEIVDALPSAVTIVDYAHNALSMRSALETLRKYEPKRLVVLFGSVGGRTKERRAELGEIASKLADFVIITSDNPDFEPPEDIISDIEKAVQSTSCPYATIIDRKDAVKYAIDNARDGDLILFAGKGHENYQLVKGEYLPYSEREEILNAAKNRILKVR